MRANNPRYDSRDDLIACPECRAWMLPLKEYEISKWSESPTVGADAVEFFLWGWWAYAFNYLYDLCTFEARKKKLAKLKSTLLPQFPNSLVCTRCLHIRKRT